MVELCGDSNGNEFPHCHNCYAHMTPQTTFLLVRFSSHRSICLLLLPHLCVSIVEEHKEPKGERNKLGLRLIPLDVRLQSIKRRKRGQELTHCWLWQLQQSSSH